MQKSYLLPVETVENPAQKREKSDRAHRRQYRCERRKSKAPRVDAGL
jgi:hypothetical protein